MARHSPDEPPESRARQLAVQLPVDGVIQDGDLLTTDEGRVDDVTREFRFDIPLLARRVAGAADWFVRHFAPHAGDKGESPGAGHRGR